MYQDGLVWINIDSNVCSTKKVTTNITVKAGQEYPLPQILLMNWLFIN